MESASGFPDQPEIGRWLQYVADQLDLRRDALRPDGQPALCNMTTCLQQQTGWIAGAMYPGFRVG